MDCECAQHSPPPPAFHLPPPPTPPILELAHNDCKNADDVCESMLIMDAHNTRGWSNGGGGWNFGTNSNVDNMDTYVSGMSGVLPSVAVIVICSSLLVALVTITGLLVWKHKRRRQLLPCKGLPPLSQPGEDLSQAANGGVVAIYEDIQHVIPTSTTVVPEGMLKQHPIEVEVKYRAPDYALIANDSPVFVCGTSRQPGHQCPRHIREPPRLQFPLPPSMPPPPPPTNCDSQHDLYNPVYEELSNSSLHAESSASCSPSSSPLHSEAENEEDGMSTSTGSSPSLHRPSFLLPVAPQRRINTGNLLRRHQISVDRITLPNGYSIDRCA